MKYINERNALQKNTGIYSPAANWIYLNLIFFLAPVAKYSLVYHQLASAGV